MFSHASVAVTARPEGHFGVSGVVLPGAAVIIPVPRVQHCEPIWNASIDLVESDLLRFEDAADAVFD